MDLIISLLMGFLTDPILLTVVAVILVGWAINALGVDQSEDIVGFSYTEMPQMQPIRIPTDGKGFWKSIWHWVMGVRQWEIAKDWNFEVNGQKYVIPKGFQFDGASVPKFLAMWLSPVGILLMGGLVHDYLYMFRHLMKKGKKSTSTEFTRKQADEMFRDICIEQNGIHVLNWVAYLALRVGGWVAWNGHRKND